MPGKMPKVRATACVSMELNSDKGKHKFWKEDAEKVCDDEEDITGKIAIVTGSSSGIGRDAALQLAKRGAIVIMAIRNLEKGKEILDGIKEQIGKDVKIEMMKVDMADMQSIRDFVKEFEAKYPHLHILVNNAGVMDTSKVLKKTKDGLEMHVATNHIGPLLLTHLLLESLKRGAPSRIICVASFVIAHVAFDLEDLTTEPTKVKTADMGSEQYYVSKLFGAIGMVKIANSLEGTGIKLFQMDPGFVQTNMSAGVMSNLNWVMEKLGNLARSMMAITPHQSAETIVYLAVAKSLAEQGDAGKGEIYRFMKIWKQGDELLKEYDQLEETAILYKRSLEIAGLAEKQ